jgi:di/tricarboxylate transporter
MEPYLVIGLLVGAVILFATEKISVDLVTLALLSLLVMFGVLNVQEAFAGFGNEIIVMLGSIFIIGAALRDTGVLDSLGSVLARTAGGSPKKVAAGMMTCVGAISAFMNNTTVTAMFLGPVIGMARRLKISPSRLLMPLSFASILGGTVTLIGTSTNVAVSGAMKMRGLDEIGMFEIAPIGVILFAVGLIYLVSVGMKWVPERDRAEQDQDGGQIREYFSEVVVLPGSPLIGQAAFNSDFSVLEFQVVKVTRGEEDLVLGPYTFFEEGDVVLVAGKVQNLIKVKKIEGIDIREDVQLRRSGADTTDASVAEVVLTPRSNLVGHTLRGSNFRRETGLSVLALLRGDRTLNDHMADVVLHAGDLLLVQGAYDRIQKFEQEAEMVVITEHRYSTTARKRGIALLIAFALAVTASSIGLLPASVAFLITALIALATRCIALNTAYENIDWRLLILIGGMTAFGTAMAKSGADELLAGTVTHLLEPFGAVTVMAGFCILTILLTQPMSNAAAALVVLPIALQAAEKMGADPRSFGIAVMLSASISVLTPFEPSCILVYGPGKYRFSDFIKVGSGLTVVTLASILLLVPYFWPLKP